MASTTTLGSGAAGPGAGGAGSPAIFAYRQALPQADDQLPTFQLKTLFRILRRRRRVFAITAVAITVAWGVKTIHERITAPVFEGSFTMLISDPVRDPGGETGLIGSVARNQSRYDLPTLVTMLQSQSVLRPVYEELGRRHPGSSFPGLQVGMLQATLGEGRSLVGGMLQVKGRGNDPALVRETLQLTEQAYLDWALSQRREKITDGLAFLDQESPALEARSNQLQSQLADFRRQHNLLQPLGEASAMRSQVETLRTKLIEQQEGRNLLIKTKQDVMAGRLTTRAFGSSASESAAPGSATNVQVTVPDQALLDEFTKLEIQIAEAQSKYRPESSVLRNLIASRDRLKPLLQAKQLETLDAALDQFDNSITTTRAQIALLEGRFQDQPELLKQYDQLVRQLKVAEDTLNGYLNTREQFQLQMAQENVPWRIVGASSVGSNPVEPSVPRGLLTGLLLGLVGGTGAALLRDRLDHVFHSPSEVREDLAKPLLGHIPHIAFFEGVRAEKRFLLGELDDQEGGMAGYQRFYYQEAFRNLYTSLRFLNTDRPLRSLALTSSIPSEGKSLTLVLLAKTLSELGQKVLLVDADLRKPQIHTRLGINNLAGLSNLLSDEHSSWRTLRQAVAGYENWDVITAGGRTPDPPRLLSSERMRQLVRDIAESGDYDVVLYDTPPVLGLSDASLLAEHLDGIMLLVTMNQVDRSLPAEALKRLEDARSPLLGLITNAVVKSEVYEKAYAYQSGRYRYQGYGTEATYNPSTAYGYYAHSHPSETDQQSADRGWLGWLPSNRRLRHWTTSVKRWLD